VAAVSEATRPITQRSALELAASIRAGELSSREVVDAHIARTERHNDRVNAVVATRFEQARAEADAADARIAAADDGAELPPLLGVPCTIKESFALQGMPNSSGLRARREVIASRSATAVARLVDAGAIPLGVTNLSELTLWVESTNTVYGRTNNAYDPARMAGGSSGGEGASVGSGFAPIGLGTDFGGSIRQPAFFNGVFGHKPTSCLVPHTGHYPAPNERGSRMLGIGPLARRAEDLMPFLRAVAGPDGEDTTVRGVELGDPAQRSRSRACASRSPRTLRFCPCRLSCATPAFARRRRCRPPAPVYARPRFRGSGRSCSPTWMPSASRAGCASC
jgi:fatty acid amide hydrolase 2